MRLVAPLALTLALVLAACGGQDPLAPTGPDDGSSPDAATEEPVDDPTDDPADAPAASPAAEPTDEPASDDTSDDDVVAGEGDCSAFGLDGTVRGAGELSEEALATATFLLDAAVRCDEQLLFTAAEESGTSFFFGSASVDEVFALPEDPDADPAPWEALARLLHGTTPVVGDGDVWTWPAAAAAGADDAAWQELVDSGLYTAAQVEELRSAGDGYLGWRTGIESDGTWLFFTAGD